MNANVRINDEHRYARRIAADAVRIVRTLPGPVDRIWDYLVDGEKRRLWLAAGDFEPQVGAATNLTFRNADLSPEPGRAAEKYRAIESCAELPIVITKFEPKSLLAFTWNGASEVTFELERAGSDVRLTITHERLSGREGMLSVSGGWHAHLDILEDVLAGRTPKNFWASHAVLEAEYEKSI